MDIGIGNGLYLSYQHQNIQKYGTDLSNHFTQELHGMGIKLFVCNAEKDPVPLPDLSCDVVMLNHLIEHVHNYDFLVSECRRLLKPGGGLLIRTPNIARVKASFWNDCTHIKPYSIQGLEHLAKIHSFAVLKTFYSDHPRIVLDCVTGGKFEKIIFSPWLPGGNEIEAYWVKS